MRACGLGQTGKPAYLDFPAPQCYLVGMKTITGSLIPGKKGMLRPIFTCSCKHVMEEYPLAPVVEVECPNCHSTKTFRIVEFAPKQWRIK